MWNVIAALFSISQKTASAHTVTPDADYLHSIRRSLSRESAISSLYPPFSFSRSFDKGYL